MEESLLTFAFFWALIIFLALIFLPFFLLIAILHSATCALRSLYFDENVYMLVSLFCIVDGLHEMIIDGFVNFFLLSCHILLYTVIKTDSFGCPTGNLYVVCCSVENGEEFFNQDGAVVPKSSSIGANRFVH